MVLIGALAATGACTSSERKPETPPKASPSPTPASSPAPVGTTPTTPAGTTSTDATPTPPSKETRARIREVQQLEWTRDPSVVKFIDDADPLVRLAAVRAVGRIAAPGDEIAAASSGQLMKRLAEWVKVEPDARVVREGLTALGLGGTADAADVLIAMRDKAAEKNGPATSRAVAARALGFSATEEQRTALIAGLKSEVEEVRTESALGLGLLEKNLQAAGARSIDEATRAALLACLVECEQTGLVRHLELAHGLTFALGMVARGSDEARTALTRVLVAYGNEDIAMEAARGLSRSAVGAVASQAAPGALYAESADPRVACELVRALGKHRTDPKARAKVIAYLDHPSFHARRVACGVLATPAFLETDMSEAEMAALVKKLEDPSLVVRGAALEAIAKSDPGRGLPLTRAFVESKEPGLRMAGADALGALLADMGTAKDARAALEKLVREDKVHRVRTAALTALGKSEEGALVIAFDLCGAEEDPGVFEVAVDLVGNGLENYPEKCEDVLAHAYDRVRDHREHSEAREGIANALGERGAELGEVGRNTLERARTDPVPSVAFAAGKALAAVKGDKAPEAPKRERKVSVEPTDFQGKKPILLFETTRGAFEVELYPEDAPLHCASIWKLASSSFYDGLSWHRVESTFVIQGGDPHGDGTGDAGFNIPDELSARPYVRGTLGMPKTQVKDTGGCQLFFTHGRAPHLDGHYTVFGQIRKGVEVIDLIEAGDRITSVKTKLE